MFFDEAGQSRAIAVNGQAAAASIGFDIGPLGSAVFAATGGGAVRPGSARVVVKEGVAGGVVRVGSKTSSAHSAGASDMIAGFIAPVHRSRATGANTEVAISSTATPLTLTLLLHDAAGKEVPGGRAQMPLGANGALSLSIDALFPKADLSDFQGALIVRAEGGAFAAAVTEASTETRAARSVPVVTLRD